LARRAAASAARHDFEHALQDYDEACKLAPNEASYFLQRGMLKINSLHQFEQGASDVNRAIVLKPDYVDALMARARIELRKHAVAQAVSDLNTIDRTAPKEANLRLDLAGLYYEAESFPDSIAQLDLWIPHHSQDVRLSHAYNDRCWLRALQGTGLDQALSDCNAGLRLNPKSAELLDSRGLVQMRKGAYDKAIADFDAALKLNPKQPWSLYCRGVAKAKAGHKQDGEADMAAALATNSNIAGQAKRFNIEPPH
jgi:tetratricopeptide (TPR) repeat protein